MAACCQRGIIFLRKLKTGAWILPVVLGASLCFSSSLRAGVVFTPGSGNVTPGQSVFVPITVASFTDVTSITFTS